MSDKRSTGKARSARATVLELEKWLPYRCSVVANTVSRRLADFYYRRFGLTVHAWRMMAVLGRRSALSALDLARLTAMDQVSVTRALNHLSALGLLIRGTDAKDRRKAVLELSVKGRGVYRTIVPLALDLEARLTTGLTRADLEVLDRLLARVQQNAASLQEDPMSSDARAGTNDRKRQRATIVHRNNGRAVRMPRALVL